MRILLTAFVAALVACGGDRGDWAGTVRDSAGVKIVENPAGGIWSGNGWTVETDLHIGTAEGDPDYQFGTIAGIAIGPSGEMFVLDQTGAHVTVFGPDGKHLRTFGGRGSGPGELSPQTQAIMFGTGDTLFVGDLGNQRMNLYDTAGASLGSFRIGMEQGLPLRWEGSPTGQIVHQLRDLNLPNQTAGATPPDTMDAIVVRRPDGMLGDTLLQVPSGKTLNFGGGLPEFHLFSPEPIWALGPSEVVYYGVNNQYRIMRYAHGALQQVVTRPFELSAVTEDDQGMILDAVTRAWQDAGLAPQAITMLRPRIHFAPTYPAYAQFLAGPEGTLWVQRLEVPGEMTAEERKTYNPLQNLGADRWDVFDAEGRYLGEVTMPQRFQPMKFSGWMIYGVQRDELDVQYVVRAKIARPEA